MGNAHDIDTMNAHVAKMMQDKDIFAKIKDKSKQPTGLIEEILSRNAG